MRIHFIIIKGTHHSYHHHYIRGIKLILSMDDITFRGHSALRLCLSFLQAQTRCLAPQSRRCRSALLDLLHYWGYSTSQQCKNPHAVFWVHMRVFVCTSNLLSLQDRGAFKSSLLLCDIILAFIDSCVVWWISFNIHTCTHTNTLESSEYDESTVTFFKGQNAWWPIRFEV